MKDRNFHLHDGSMGAAITVHVVPGSPQDAVNHIMGDGTVVIDLAGPKNQEHTNEALIQFLANVLQINPSQLEIVGGLAGSDKLISILDVDKETVQARITGHIK